MTTRQILSIAVDDGCDIPARELAGFIHQAIPGSHTLENIEIDAEVTDFEWDDDQPPLPLDKAAARELMDDNGCLTMVTAIDQEQFLAAHLDRAVTSGVEDENDLVHDQVLAFGSPYDPTLRILAVSGSDLIVSYTTVIAGWF